MKKVLIVEDNKDLLDIYKMSFESENFIVQEAKDWMEWIIKLLEKIPDIIILDIMMPSMNGFEVLKTIKEQSSINVPIIVCSNLSSDEDEEKVMSSGADMYLRKSEYTAEEVVAKAMDLLNKKRLKWLFAWPHG